ncbi:glyoxylate utilization-related uncharacterized protein [Prauserella isguenensis]|uniref:Glyoxylate utilization-related uncharacterized protein n=1 Tax=Prauserella isguenensis TaxID=1470180 RepID=A0A839S0W1_9PSEU|nr:glyoxylate utilization-related uncharacterized protein [Prauserella isguenensis]
MWKSLTARSRGWLLFALRVIRSLGNARDTEPDTEPDDDTETTTPNPRRDRPHDIEVQPCESFDPGAAEPYSPLS